MAKKTFLDFEQPIAELETKIEELRYVQTESAVDISDEIDQLSKKSQQLTKEIYSDLTPWQVTKIARHSDRPYTLDYVNEIFTHFVELHGDWPPERPRHQRTCSTQLWHDQARGVPQSPSPDEAG